MKDTRLLACLALPAELEREMDVIARAELRARHRKAAQRALRKEKRDRSWGCVLGGITPPGAPYGMVFHDPDPLMRAVTILR